MEKHLGSIRSGRKQVSSGGFEGIGFLVNKEDIRDHPEMGKQIISGESERKVIGRSGGAEISVN